MKKTILIAAGLAAALMASTVQAKTLVYCSEGSPEGFDPALYTAGTTFDASSKPIYNRLVEFENGTTKVIPGLAESWNVSDDGLELTFKLRSGVKFHSNDVFTPTRDFNADDVVFTFERQLNEDSPWHKYTEGTSWEYFSGMDMPSLIKEIVKVDDMTVKFVLNRPEAPIVANMAMDFASVFSKEYADKLEGMGSLTDLNQKPIGTGPFSFVAYQKDAVIRYAAHADYWDGKQPIDNLIFAITTDNSVRAQKVRKARKAMDMSQTELGNLLGVSFQQVQKYEKGSNRIGSGRLWEISRVLRVPIDYFFDGIDDEVSSDTAVPWWLLDLAKQIEAIKDEKLQKQIISLIETCTDKK